MIETLLADGADESFGVRVRTRRTDRSADGLDTDRGEHLVEAGGELGVPVADEESEHPTGILQVRGEIAGHLGDPWAVRVGGRSEDVHDAALHFDDEQHVVAPQEDRVDVEEVRGHNALGLGGEELGPGWALSPGCRWETVAAQHGRDARLRHADAELLQLADDAEITPPGVLPSQAADQLHGLFGKTRTTWSAVRVGPALLDQRAVPAQDRLWADEERSPVFSRNKTGQEGDEGPVGPSEAGTGDLPVQHSQLVAEYEDLSVLGRGIHPMDANDLNDASEETVEKGQGHDQQASPSLLWLVKLGQAVSGPFRGRTEDARPGGEGPRADDATPRSRRPSRPGLDRSQPVRAAFERARRSLNSSPDDPATSAASLVRAAFLRLHPTRLVLSSHTVRNYVQNVLAKLGAHSKLEAVVIAVREGLVRFPR